MSVFPKVDGARRVRRKSRQAGLDSLNELDRPLQLVTDRSEVDRPQNLPVTADVLEELFRLVTEILGAFKAAALLVRHQAAGRFEIQAAPAERYHYPEGTTRVWPT